MPQASVVTSSRTASSYAAPSSFVCTWRTAGHGSAWVHVAGELDVATSSQLRRTLREAQPRAGLLVLDLRELTFIDSSGVRVILDAADRARRVGDRVVLVRGPVEVDRALTLSGASDQILIFDLDPTEPSQALFGDAA